MTDPLNQLYARVLRNHPYGYALYGPESSLVLKPGTCGYLTENGAWTPLLDLSDPAAVQACGFTPFNSISRAPPNGFLWGPKKSDSVTRVDVELKAKAPVFQGVNVQALLKFTSKKDSGAVLLTKGEVTRDSVYYREPYKEWCRDNSARILKLEKWADVRQHGLWVVTETWNVANYAINAWRDVEKSLLVGFDAGYTPVGEIGPTADWHVSAADDGWIVSQMTNPSDRRVVFFGGIFFRYHKRQAALVDTAYKFKGTGKFMGTSTFTLKDPQDQQSEIVVDVEEFGKEQSPPDEDADLE